MIYKISLTLNNHRKTPIFSHYRPDWVSLTKPEYNCAQVLLNDRQMLYPGETCECRLQPAMVNLWTNIAIGDILKCMEGLNEVGIATVLHIENDTLYPSITFPDKESEEKYQKIMEDHGFQEIVAGPTINLNEVKRRRFNSNE